MGRWELVQRGATAYLGPLPGKEGSGYLCATYALPARYLAFTWDYTECTYRLNGQMGACVE